MKRSIVAMGIAGVVLASAQRPARRSADLYDATAGEKAPPLLAGWVALR
jgi:hypothetical protein